MNSLPNALPQRPADSPRAGPAAPPARAAWQAGSAVSPASLLVWLTLLTLAAAALVAALLVHPAAKAQSTTPPTVPTGPPGVPYDPSWPWPYPPASPSPGPISRPVTSPPPRKVTAAPRRMVTAAAPTRSATAAPTRSVTAAPVRSATAALGTKVALPATRAARRIMATIRLIERRLVKTRYQHTTYISLRRGLFYWDCSAMAGWVLRRAAPRARRALYSGRPLAKHFYRQIARSPTDRARRGWRRIDHVADLRPGDLFAWLRPRGWKRRNTGHVGFILSRPWRHRRYPNVWLMRVADVSRFRHQGDSRPVGTNGFGTGTMAFSFDKQGNPVAYGWYGALYPPYTFVPTKITFGRVTR